MNTIIVLTDFSNSASNAARYAAGLTHQIDVKNIILFNSYEYKPVATDIPMSGQVGMNVLRQQSITKLQELKSELLTLASEKTRIEVLASENPLILAIHSLINLYHPELTVMGITGMSGFERALIGSNTINIAKEISSPLLLIPKSASFRKINKVVFATDLSAGLQRSAAEIKRIINSLAADLIILNVESAGADHFNADMVTEHTELHDLWDNENPEYYFIEKKDVAEGITEFIKTHDTQLLIAIPKKHGFFESIFRKSITKELTYHTPVPLLLLQEMET
jgi:nucleotide-binding universal stress UspA family protein